MGEENITCAEFWCGSFWQLLGRQRSRWNNIKMGLVDEDVKVGTGLKGLRIIANGDG
jgi:hypothetical protein